MQYVVEVASEALIAELESGIAQHNKNRRYSNSRRICDLIEQFVDSLYQTPDWSNELINRATFVEKRCGDESKYELARSEALKSYKGQSSKLSRSKLAIRRLRSSNRPLQLLAEVDSVRNDINKVLDDGILDLSKASRKAFEKWERACRDVQREARVLNVDGCWYLYHIHACGEDTPSRFSKSARGMMLTDAGGVNLRTIKSAVIAMQKMAGAAGTIKPLEVSSAGGDNSELILKPPQHPKKPKRSTQKGEAKAKLIAALTLHHQYEEGSCLNQEPIGCNELASKAQVANSTASAFFAKNFGGHDKYRRMCSNLKKLIPSLKLLNGEYPPSILYGRSPLGEGVREEDK